MLFYDNINLVLAALFHDIHKPTQGKIITTEKGDYWSNNRHAQMSEDMILNEQSIKKFITDNEGNWEIIAIICKEHMNVKFSETRMNKIKIVCPLIEKFHKCDDMVRKEEIETEGEWILPRIGKVSGLMTFCSMSPIQDRARNGEFTITVNRTPYTFNFKEIPQFFNSKKYEFLKPYLNILKK